MLLGKSRAVGSAHGTKPGCFGATMAEGSSRCAGTGQEQGDGFSRPWLGFYSVSHGFPTASQGNAACAVQGVGKETPCKVTAGSFLVITEMLDVMGPGCLEDAFFTFFTAGPSVTQRSKKQLVREMSIWLKADEASPHEGNSEMWQPRA